MKTNYLKSLLAIAMSGALLYGCSDDSSTTDGSGVTGSTAATGVFIDAKVDGLQYSSPSSGNGITQNGGQFKYAGSELVKFYLGSINLGSSAGKAKVTPLDLITGGTKDSVAVKAMASVLQSLDGDKDISNGIQIGQVHRDGLAALVGSFDFTSPDADFTALDQKLQDYINQADVDLTYVDPEAAVIILVAGLLEEEVYLTNVSRTPGQYTEKAGLEEIESGELKALVMTYGDETGGTGEGSNIAEGYGNAWAAVSYDNGLTWEKTNLSGNGGKKMSIGSLEFNIDNQPPSMAVEGNYVLVSWISTSCKTNPYAVDETYSDISPILDPDQTNPAHEEADLFKLTGAQGIVAYSFGNVPYHCVWTTRGVLDDGLGKMVWYEPQMLTSGRRDAKIDGPAGSEGAGFGVTWQEDPDGLEPGLGEGPGLGWSGATTHHKTDIWYSAINWNDFNTPTTDSCVPAADEETVCRPVAQKRLMPPVRVSDNDGCKDDTNNTALYCNVTETNVAFNNTYCDKTVEIDSGTFCQTTYNDEDGTPVHYLLDGNTAASRPNLDFAVDGDKVLALVTYEETKGLCRDESDVGKGCPDEPWLTGKFMMYHHFEFDKPDTVNHGYIMAQPAVGDEIYDGEDGIGVAYDVSQCDQIDVNEDGVLDNGCYENTRRERFTVNTDPTASTKVVLIYKQGAFKQGERADIFLRRAVGGFKSSNFEDDVCVSCGTSSVVDGEVVTTWHELDGLDDGSTTNIMDDARSLRAALDGDRVLIGFAHTDDWKMATTPDANFIYGDNYNYMVRRSLDGGATWNIPYNTSNLPNKKISVVEPRLATVEDPDQKTFVATYCTSANVVRVASSDGVPTHPPGLDCYYSRTTDDGDTYENLEDDDKWTLSDGKRFTCLACAKQEEVEPEVFLTPDGNTMHSAWVQNGDMEDEGSDIVNGSDAWYRQISIESTPAE